MTLPFASLAGAIWIKSGAHKQGRKPGYKPGF
jgi:hypothetical protein